MKDIKRIKLVITVFALIAIIPITIYPLAGWEKHLYTSFDNVLQTSKYKGHYYYTIEGGSGAFGSLIIYPETDTTFLFYIEANRGAPGYNSGAMYSRAYMTCEDKFEAKDLFSDCNYKLIYSGKIFSVETSCENQSLGFGANVRVTGSYEQQNDSIYEYFITRTNDTIFFRKVSPEYFQNGYFF